MASRFPLSSGDIPCSQLLAFLECLVKLDILVVKELVVFAVVFLVESVGDAVDGAVAVESLLALAPTLVKFDDALRVRHVAHHPLLVAR